jgi:small neutral amino acid transporter SnatA (MarC family)
MRPPSLLDPAKIAQADRPLRRAVVRRLLGLTLVVAGLAMLLSGVNSAFFR